MKALAALLIAGCAVTGNNTAFDRCSTGRVIDACNPADYPALALGPETWPFPRLMVPIEEAEPKLTPEQEAAKRLLEKLGK